MQLNSSFFSNTLTSDFTVKQGQFSVELSVKYAGSPKVAKRVERTINDSMGHYAAVQRLVTQSEEEKSQELATDALLESIVYSSSLNDSLLMHLVNGYYDYTNELVILDDDGVAELLEYLTTDSVKAIIEYCSNPANFGIEPLEQPSATAKE